MFSAFLIALREGLEMSLIVGVLLAYLARTGHRRHFPAIWAGVAGAVALSVAAGAVIHVTAGEFVGRGQQLYEAAALLTAVAVLTYMIFWMRRHAVSIRSDLQVRMSEALRIGSPTALALLTVASVGREGVETALLLFATARASSTLGTTAGALFGFGIAILLGWLLYRGTYKLDLRAFFNVTSTLLLLVGAGLLARGIGELQEAGIVPPLVEHVWNTNAILNQSSPVGNLLEALFGYTSSPSLLQVLVYAMYLLAVGWYYYHPVRGSPEGRPPRPLPRQVETAAPPRP
jgi:high-affinity iron transporter